CRKRLRALEATLFPSTTLFRSIRRVERQASVRGGAEWAVSRDKALDGGVRYTVTVTTTRTATLSRITFTVPTGTTATARVATVRSEEHTSELKSLAYLVCRLLH